MTNYNYEEYSFAKVAEYYNQTIISLNFVVATCNYEDGSTRDVLCVDYRYIDSTGAVTRKRLFPRYAVSASEMESLNGKEISDVLFRHGFSTDPDTGEEIPASNKWTAFCNLDGEWTFLEGRKSDWEVAHPEQ